MAGRPPFLAGQPFTFYKTGRPAVSLHKMAGRLPKMAGNAAVYPLGPVLPFEGEFQAFPCNGRVKGLHLPPFRMRSGAQIVRSTLRFVKSFLSSCCFVYRVVVLLVELFVELSYFVFLSCYSLFKLFV